MSLHRRGAFSALLLCLPVLAAPAAALAAPDNPSGADAKTTDALVRDALKSVVNEGADMYNGAPPRYTVPDYLGCFHLYEGALIAVRPLLANHADLQKAIDDGLDDARNTPDTTKRAFVLRAVIDQVRGALKPGGPTVAPPAETTFKGKIVKAEKGKLTVTGDDGKEITFTVPADAGVTINGKAGKVEDVKADDVVTVTAKGGEATQVAAVRPVEPPPPPPPPKVEVTGGKVVSAAKDKLTVAVDGKEKDFVVPPEAKVTIDGADGKITDAKPDGTATVSTRDGKVVAIDVKNPTPPPDKSGKTTGKVTKAEGGKLTVKPETGDAKDFAIPDDAKVTIDGKEGKAADIKAGDLATITFDKDGKITAVDVKPAAAPPRPPAETKTSGKVIKVTGDKISVLPATGEAKEFTVPDEVKITLDAKDAKLADLTKDTTVTVTEAGGKVTKIEGKAPAAPPPPPPAETLWDRLGGEKGVGRVVDDFANAAGSDPKVNFWRDPTHVPSKEEVADLKTNLVAFVSKAAGGPLKYTGKDMKDAHKGMKITDAEFDACAADLKAALEKNGVKADDVKAVMGAVEGTRKDIVEVKGDEKPKPPEDKPAETGTVQGKVVLDGQPLAAGTLTLINDDGKPAYSGKITDGSYSIKDVKAGIYKITVSATVDADKPDLVPAKYQKLETTPLVVTVKKGQGAFDLDLAK